MSVLYGKVKIYSSAGSQITITSALGVTKTVTVPSDATFVDVPLVGLEEYTLTKGTTSKTVLLNYGDFVEVTLWVIFYTVNCV